MDIPVCSSCKSSMYQETPPMIGAILVCDHCSAIYQVLQTEPLRLQLMGTTGELQNPPEK
ncbi:MAG: hypothetical protein R3335_03680 [Anaerolineales bacterium]|nr:hypothetical protein [Anaerolineales bacterium]